jgi:hypothetical protein
MDAEITKISGEITQQTLREQELHLRLREIATELQSEFGFHWNMHSLVTLKRQTLSRILYLDELYKKIISVPGVICEFGVHWGSSIAQLINLRGMYEPYNHSRTIFGFDTFQGFSALDKKDSNQFEVGDYSVPRGYLERLDEILAIHESFSPISQIKKFELIPGDASETIIQWLENNPHAIISMAIFDMDVYRPTRDVLNLIIPRLTKGSLLVFDELNCPHFPGETQAVMEVLGLNNVSLKRHSHQPYCAWGVYGE